MPARHASRALWLGNISRSPSTPRCFFARPTIIESAPCLGRQCALTGSVPRQAVPHSSTMQGNDTHHQLSGNRMTSIASNLQIDSARLWDTIHETAKFGATPKGGVRRLTLGPEEKQVREWL